MHKYTRLTGVAALILLSFSAPGSPGALAQVQLPTLGDRISGLISLDDEYTLGKEFLRTVRRSSQTISDPLLNDYLVNVTHNLALHSELEDYRLSFIIIDSPELNAFAAPGGIIGVNGGLFLNAHTEGEFASVMAHELAHVSQRHFAAECRGQQLMAEATAGRSLTALTEWSQPADHPGAGLAAVWSFATAEPNSWPLLE